MRMCDLRIVRAVTKIRGSAYSTILMMKFASRALYAVPRVHIQSEEYFGI